MEIPIKRKRKDKKPLFQLKNRQKTPTLKDVNNLIFWLLSEHIGHMPNWIFVKNKHKITQVVLIFMPGLDLITLK